MSNKNSNNLFIRNSSGMTKDLTAKDTFSLNFLYLGPASGIAYALTFAFFFPNANWLLSTLLGVLLAAPIVFMYYYIGIMMPRTAADYIYVSRYLGIRLGILQALVNIFGYGIGLDVQTEISLVIIPFLQSLGVIFHNNYLISLGKSLICNQSYFFLFTLVLILIVMGILLLSTKWIARTVFLMATIQLIGTIIIISSLFYIGHSGYVYYFNHISEFFGGPTYCNINKLYGFSNGFGLFDTLMLGIMIMGSIFIYSNAPIWMGSEIKKVNKGMKYGLLYSYLVAAIIALVLAYAIIYAIGSKFFIITSEYGWLNQQGKGIPISPFSLLAYAIIPFIGSNNVILLLIVLISALTWFISYAILGGLLGSRAMFALSFDRLLPEKFADIHSKLKSPYISILVFFGFSIIFDYLEIFDGFSLSMLFGIISYMIFQYLIASLATFKISKSLDNKNKNKLFLFSLLSVISILLSISILITYGALTFYPNGFGYVLYSGNIYPSIILLASMPIASFVWYEIVKYIRKRQGLEIEKVFKEIPPD